MEILTAAEANALTVTLSGRLDSGTAPELEQVLKDTMPGITRLVFELRGLDYMSSAGLRILLASQKKMKSVGGTMVICHANDDIREVFTVTGMINIFTLSED